MPDEQAVATATREQSPDAPSAPAGPPPGAPTKVSLVRRVATSTLTGLVTIWIITFAYFSLTQDRFLTGGNLRNMLEENAVVFVVAIAETMIVLMAGIDLSSGGLLALTGLILTMSNHGTPEWLAILLTILGAGLLGGIVNGLPIGRFGMNAFVVTLGSLTIFRGLANVTTNGNTYVLDHAAIATKLSTEDLGPFPFAVVVMAVVFGLFYFLLRWTFFGRDIYAIGGNQEAAALAGVRVTRVKVTAYALLGLVVGLAAVLASGRLSSAAPSSGTGLELLAVAAVLLGGTSLGGGRGSVVGTAIAVLFLATIDNGLRISGVSSFWENVVTGVILIVAVGLAQLRNYAVENRRPRRSQPPTKEQSPA